MKSRDRAKEIPERHLVQRLLNPITSFFPQPVVERELADRRVGLVKKVVRWASEFIGDKVC
jgi:hypothetical protein